MGDSDGIIHLSPILLHEGSLCREEVTLSPNIASLIVNNTGCALINIVFHRLHSLLRIPDSPFPLCQ